MTYYVLFGVYQTYSHSVYCIFDIKHIHTLQTITIVISLPIVLYTVISLSVESQAQGFTGNDSSGLSHVEQGHGVSILYYAYHPSIQ